MKGVDFAYGWPTITGAALKAAGYEFCIRYLDYPGAQGKGITAAELADYRGAGIGVGFVYESTAARMLDGNAAGAADAQQSSQSLATLGAPATQPVFFACDVDVTSDTQLVAVDAYLNGAASVLGKQRVGVYGEFDVIDHCWKAGTALWYWQTIAWSGGLLHVKRHCYQTMPQGAVSGKVVDIDESNGDTGWLWLPPAPAASASDPRIDAILRALTGLDGDAAAARIKAWNEKDGVPDGNSLLDGYQDHATRIAKLEQATPVTLAPGTKLVVSQ